MKKIAGSKTGSISQRHGSADPDPDPPQSVLDPQHVILPILWKASIIPRILSIIREFPKYAAQLSQNSPISRFCKLFL